MHAGGIQPFQARQKSAFCLRKELVPRQDSNVPVCLNSKQSLTCEYGYYQR